MLSFFLSYLLIYRYAVLFTVIALASFGFPFPATALLMAAGAFAAQGYFDFSNILVFGVFASILGDTAGYLLSLRYGRNIFMKICVGPLLLSEKFRTVEELFKNHAISSIFFSRFLATGLWPTVNILSGFSKVNYKKFLPCVIIGEILYVMIFASLGYAFGDQWETIVSISEDAISIIVLSILLLVLARLVWRAKKRNKK